MMRDIKPVMIAVILCCTVNSYAQTYLPYKVSVAYTRTVTGGGQSKDGLETGSSLNTYHYNISSEKALAHIDNGVFYLHVMANDDDYTKAGGKPFAGNMSANGESYDVTKKVCSIDQHTFYEVITKGDYEAMVDTKNSSMDFEYNLSTKKASLSIQPIGNEDVDLKLRGNQTQYTAACQNTPAQTADLTASFLQILKIGVGTNLQVNLSDPSAWANAGPGREAVQQTMVMLGWGGTPSFTKTPDGYIIAYSNGQTNNTGEGTSMVSTNLTVTIGGKAPKYEAILFAVNKDTYNKWIPRGPAIDESKQVKDGNGVPRGNDISFQLLVRDKITKQPVSIPWKARFYITEISHNKGWCMNYPSVALSDNKPDLRFDTKNPSNIFETINETNATTKNTIQDKNITVISYDYGSYGKLNADVTMEDGTKLETHVYDHTDEITYMSVPIDDNNNDIADQWERDSTIYKKNYPPNWDGEEIGKPNTNKGDGITLYEEYRGFVIKKNDELQYIKLSPNKPELLVYVKTVYKTEAKLALKYFQSNSHILPIDMGTYDVLEMVPNEVIKNVYATEPVKRWADFNSIKDPIHFPEHEVCCISIMDRLVPFNNDILAKTVLLDADFEADGNNRDKISPHRCWGIVFNIKDLSNTYKEKKKYLPPLVSFKDSALLTERYSQAFYESVGYIKRTYNVDVDINTLADSLTDKWVDVLARRMLVYALTHELCHLAGNVFHHGQDNFEGANRPFTDASLPSFLASKSPRTINAWLACDDENCYTHYLATPRFAHYFVLAVLGKWDASSGFGPNGNKLVFCTNPYDMCYQRLNLKYRE